MASQSNLSSEILQSLINRLKDKRWRVRSAAAHVLGRQSHLPSEVLQSLIGQLKDPNWDMRFSFLKALDHQCSLPLKALQSLMSLLKDPNLSMRSASAKILGQQFNLHSEVLQFLIDLLKDPDWNIRSAAVEALGQRSDLPLEVLQCLTDLCKDTDYRVQDSAAKALKKQPGDHIYRLLINQKDHFTKLYSQFLIPSNLQQVEPFYITNHTVYFYHDGQLKELLLDPKIVVQFKKNIFKAQTEAGIPSTSRIKSNLGFITRASQLFRSTLDKSDYSQHTSGVNRFWKTR